VRAGRRVLFHGDANCKMINLFPIILSILQLGASIVSFYYGNIPKGLYWFFGAGLTSTIIFMK
jgi:hypothetical protein